PAQVLLIDNPRLVYNERHDSSGAVVRRPGNQREALGHQTVIEVTHGASRGVVPLGCQDSKVVAVIWIPLIGVALCNGSRHDFTNRALVVLAGALPIQPITLTW